MFIQPAAVVLGPSRCSPIRWPIPIPLKAAFHRRGKGVPCHSTQARCTTATEIRPQSKHTTSPALTRNRGASPPNPAYGEASSCIPAPDGGSHRRKLLGIFARIRVLLRCLLLRPADRIEQEEEETRLATRKLPSTFAREISSCTWKTQGLLTLAMVCTRKELGLCDEQVQSGPLC